GLGGGSSDAATTLVALDALWGTNLGVEALCGLALRLGADVPVFVRGGNAWAEGVGDQLRPVALPDAWFVVVDPQVHVPTAELFQAPDLTRDALPVKMADFVSGGAVPLGNAFEPVVRLREPAVESAFAALAAIGVPRLTGSGSACFVEFEDRASAEAGLAALPSALRAWVVRGAARSPLHDALEAWRRGGNDN
ncbi:MAG: 4-(cytidine 5'-diphospho)-2-C-methyl-D-erythritol kinase, partial [Luteimonas sp.]